MKRLKDFLNILTEKEGDNFKSEDFSDYIFEIVRYLNDKLGNLVYNYGLKNIQLFSLMGEQNYLKDIASLVILLDKKIISFFKTQKFEIFTNFLENLNDIVSSIEEKFKVYIIYNDVYSIYNEAISIETLSNRFSQGENKEYIDFEKYKSIKKILDKNFTFVKISSIEISNKFPLKSFYLLEIRLSKKY